MCSDDAGLALQTKVAPVQVIVVPIIPNKLEDDKKEELEMILKN